MSFNFSVLSDPYFFMWFFVAVLQTAVTAWAFLRCFTVECSEWVIYLTIILSGALLPIFSKHIIVGHVVVTPIITLVLPMILCSFFTKGSKLHIIFFFIASMLMDSILELTLHILLAGDYAVLDAFDYERVVISVIFLFLITPMKYALSIVWNKLANKNENKPINWVFMVFPAAQALAYVCMMVQTVGWNIDPSKAFYFLLAAMIIFAVSDILFLKFITDSEKKQTLEEEFRAMEYTRAVEEQHYENIEAKRYETAKIRHDIKNQIIATKNLIASGKIKDAEEVIAELEKSLDKTKEYEYCGIPIINAVMGEKNADCIKNGIALEADIQLRNSDEISKNHLCCVFSNLMDNAIKANLKSDDKEYRYIKIKAANKERYFIISCENSVFGNVPDGKIEPSKSKGYGLKILCDIAAEYDGTFDIEVIDGICRSSVVLEGKTE